MASDTKNVKLGVCQVLFDGIDLGYTKGGVEVEVKTETHEVQVDQFGKTPINEYIMGRTVTVKVPLAETTLENMVAIMPGATLKTSGTDKYVEVTSAVGIDLLSSAKELRLHPVALPASNTSEDFVAPLANTPGNMNYAYKLEDERIFNCDFKAYPDPQTNKLFYIGVPDGVI